MPLSDKDKPSILSQNLFPVVGIGASAGGLDAFKKLLKAIPEDSGMAYILVQHLHPQHESILPEILQSVTKIPVEQISDNVKVQPDHIYVIPANKMLVATDGILKLSARSAAGTQNLPINIFFTSLANVHKAQSIGVVLSGNGADGTEGLKAIKAIGGLTFAQDVASAANDSMPRHAIDAGVTDFILTPEKIPEKLMELKQSFNGSSLDGHTLKDKANENAFKEIIALLRLHVGADFTFYKQTTIRRRIVRRMEILKLESVLSYLDHLKKDEAEQDALFHDLLIPVTSFFRDPLTFGILCEKILPQVFYNKVAENSLRIWIAGCSTGQEAYSIAMCVCEYLSNHASTVKVQIFATDISGKSIKTARTGRYTKKELAGVSEKRLHKFFDKTDNEYQVKKFLREMCVFAVHNFLKDPPYAKLDLVSCRNVLIYLEPFLQQKTLGVFHYALNEKGILLLGKSETTGSAADLFIPMEKRERFYTKITPPPGKITLFNGVPKRSLNSKDYLLQKKEPVTVDFQKSADDILLSKYAPAGVIVNEQFDIVQFRGSTSEYLEPAPGKASFNVLKMAKEGLAFELRNALHRAQSTGKTFIKETISINKGAKLVTIEVTPLLNTVDLYFLILFKERVPAPDHRKPRIKGVPSIIKLDLKNIRIAQLEKELAGTRDDMYSITEDQECANEELQSSNEELLSNSEELQSLNEELETTKEELQSSNEGLITLNEELNQSNEEVNRSHRFAETTLATLHEAMLLLDDKFCIKSANKSFYKTFKLTEGETLGKIIFELQHNGWNIPGLKNELVKIRAKREKMIETEISFSFPVIGKRIICINIQPLNNESGEQLLILAFDDITSRRTLEDAIAESEKRFREMANDMPQKVWTTDVHAKLNYFNKRWLDYTNIGYEQLIAGGWKKIIHPDDWKMHRETWEHSIKTGEDYQIEERVLYHDGTYHWHLSRGHAQKNSNGDIVMWVGTNTDIDEQKMFEEELKNQIIERIKLETQKNQFISMASHELKTPLTILKTCTQLLPQTFKGESYKDAGKLLERMDRQVNKLTFLINDLLESSKVKQGELAYNETMFDFNELVKETVDSLQQTTKSHTISLNLEDTDMIFGDRNRIGQVMTNMLTNAIKYSPEAKEVNVTSVHKKSEIYFCVHDFGIGISPENQTHVFEQFYRVSGGVEDTYAGLGLGMFISSEIIKKSHGTIHVESEMGKGSSFCFTLPIKKI